jgi:AraC-like DNA-binding protein
MRKRLEWIHDWERLARQASHKATKLASDTGFSLRHLERFFKKQPEKSLHAWLIDTRLRHAIELLGEGESHKEVAAEVGFSSDVALCHFFTMHTGFPPKRYLVHLHRPEFAAPFFEAQELTTLSVAPQAPRVRS